MPRAGAEGVDVWESAFASFWLAVCWASLVAVGTTVHDVRTRYDATQRSEKTLHATSKRGPFPVPAQPFTVQARADEAEAALTLKHDADRARGSRRSGRAVWQQNLGRDMAISGHSHPALIFREVPCPLSDRTMALSGRRAGDAFGILVDLFAGLRSTSDVSPKLVSCMICLIT